jgi:Short C-terminal domain
MFVRRGPGLVRAAATTAVVAGTAGAVRHRQEQKYARQDQEAYEAELAAQQAAAPAAAPEAPAAQDYAAELEQLAQLKAKGIISEEEFEAKKKQILGL